EFGYNATPGPFLGNALAQSWPTMVNRLHEARAGAAYKVMKDLRIGLNYLFERYTLDDFANTGGYVAGASANENSTRYVWTGGDRFDYTAHVLGTYLTYKF
ncbi:MAG: MtrB/PioB family outer membrane beta-barrel protein, partial [Elusimicrobiota bacterium]